MRVFGDFCRLRRQSRPFLFDYRAAMCYNIGVKHAVCRPKTAKEQL